MNHTDLRPCGRRFFFKKLALMGSALALGPLTVRRLREAPKPPVLPEAGKKNYRLTPHIRKYYETTAK